MTKQVVRWNIFAGIIFSVIGMTLLNYYSLFPEADKTKQPRPANTDAVCNKK